MPSTLLDPTLLSVAAVISSLALAALALPNLIWFAGFKRHASEHRRTTRLVDDSYLPRRRDWIRLYDFVDALELGDRVRSRRSSRLAARVLLVHRMAPELRSDGCSMAMSWAQVVSDFARKMTLEERLPLRPFLATFHLSVIREGALAEPFLAWALLTDEPASPAEEDVHVALALRDVACAYNSVAAQQRELVTFLGRSGAIQLGPPWWTRPLRSVQDRVPFTFRRLWWRPYVQGWRLRRAVDAARRAIRCEEERDAASRQVQERAPAPGAGTEQGDGPTSQPAPRLP